MISSLKLGLQRSAATLPVGETGGTGPSAEELSTIPTIYIGEARNSSGESVALRLVTPQVYAITFDLASRIAEMVHQGVWRRGYQTPASVFGEDFILSFDGCTLEPWLPVQ